VKEDEEVNHGYGDRRKMAYGNMILYQEKFNIMRTVSEITYWFSVATALWTGAGGELMTSSMWLRWRDL
jgi:hypothetical protein